jgi:arginyl-tRNA synthetase
MSVSAQLSHLIQNALLQLEVSSDVLASSAIVIEHPADPTHGDYATNAAMVVFSQLKKQRVDLPYQSPRALAEALVTSLQSPTTSNTMARPLFDSVTVAGPGFINFRLTKDYLVQEVQELLEPQSLNQKLVSSDWKDKKVIIEFTDPNPFKQLHIGHAYSNTVGESISRLFAAVGAQVYQACYQGDVGMHVAKSVWGLLYAVLPAMPEYQAVRPKESLLVTVKTVLEQLEKQHSPLVTDAPVDSLSEILGKAYAQGDTAYREDEAAQQHIKQINFLTFLSAQDRLVKEEGWKPQVDYSQYVDVDSELYPVVNFIYQTGRRWSMEYFEIMYGRLGMTRKPSGAFFDYYFAESVVGEYGLKIVHEYLKKGVFRESQGAIIFPGSEYGLHDRVFVNSLGLPTYEAKELGLAPEKNRLVPYDVSIIITANEIDEYFKVLLKTLAQIYPDLAAKTKHMSHGVVRLPEGKMSSRTGNIITTQQLLEAAIQGVQTILAETRAEMPVTQRDHIAQQVGLGAIKYAFLKQNIGSDITFSFEESLSFSGQSGPYLQYTHVRCKSVLEKASFDQSVRFYQSALQINTDERAVVAKLVQFSEVVILAATTNQPHIVAHYLFEVAQLFSVFYTNCPILKESNADQRQFRLVITKATGEVLAKGMWLLGIATVEQM